MKYQVKSQVPTVYQYQSIKTLMGMEPKKANGAFYASSEIFEDKRDAIKFLLIRLEIIRNENDYTNEQFKAAVDEIAEHGVLHYDAASASIEEVFEEWEPEDVESESFDAFFEREMRARDREERELSKLK
jgi:hypothetical protein